MASSSFSRWLTADDWPGFLKTHLDGQSHEGVIVDPEGPPRWTEGPPLMRVTRTERIGDIADASLDAVWLEDTGAAMGEKLALWWRKLKPGGYLGGPSCGFGFTPCGFWTLDTEAVVKRFARSTADCSEIFTGHRGNPCWFVFKRSPEPARVLVMSGSDRTQFGAFGVLSRENHRAYAARHGYDSCWLDWDDLWEEPRHPVWAKIQAVIRKLETDYWTQVWWIDADAVFLDFERHLDGYLHPSWTAVHPEFVADRVMASTGVWGATPRQLAGLRDVWSRTDRGHGFYSEELCLADSIHQRPDLWQGLQLVDHRLFNAVPGKGISYPKAEDHFIVHFAGCGNGQRGEIIRGINDALGISSVSGP